MAEQAKYEGLLDSLPDSILCHILSFLPTRDAVRTSVLTPRWRHLFTSSISKLDFKDCLPELGVPEERSESFKKFVERLLFSPKLQRLECFRMHDLWVVEDDFLSVYNWLSAALWRGVKELDVNLFEAELWQFPTLLFTCSSLVTLKLDIHGGELEVPTNVCLSNLRALHLSSMKFADDCSFLRLISGCPVLEVLVLFGCFINGASELNIHGLSLKRLVLDFWNLVYENDFDWLFVIDAPSLVYFEYFCRVGRGYALRNMESLEKADITIFNFNDVDRERRAALLRGICSVQVLHLSIVDDDAPLLRTPLDPVLAFNNLVELQCKNPPDVTWLVEFLHRAPNLKTLILDLADADGVLEPVPEQVPSCLLYHLKEISIVSFKRDTHMFKLVSYFLNHASVLEKVAIIEYHEKTILFTKEIEEL
ncbi:hypothetical protein V6N13_038611 [Hibiscus sabdariffa]|uniref:Uncharacterized protein n=2 Tax=Hibiscus sabdariffa TaxID=183260 RepID=A0ABR2B5M5_9ROSI